ncbi:MAG: hypothetical protein QE263_05970 [Vampirovibrionales bacterium]|nr:hypothetical protein [Vampirovibrionales bacterium]
MTLLASYTANTVHPLAKTSQGPPPALPRFSGGLSQTSVKMFSRLEAEPLREVLAKDVFGFNAPRLIVAGAFRGIGDFFDTLWSEAANTAATVLGTKLLVPIYRKLGNLVAKVKDEELRLLPEQLADLGVADRTKRYLAHLAGDIGFLIPFGALPLANPFIRNAITLWKTGTSDFETIVGLRKGPQPTKPKTPNPKDKLSYHLNKVAWINGLGFALGAALTIGLGVLSRKMKPQALEKNAKWIESLFKTFGLTGRKHDQITGEPAVFLFWLLPAYVGWYIAARSKNEKWESVIKGVNSTLWFLAFNRFLVKPAMGRLFRKEIAKLGDGIQPLLKDNVQGYTDRIAKAWKGPLANSWEKDFMVGWDKLDVGTAAKPGTLLKRLEALKAVENKGKHVTQAISDTEKLIAFWKDNPETHGKFQQLKTKADWLNYGVAIAMLATTPALINVWLTSKRFAKQQQKEGLSSGVAAAAPLWELAPSSPLQSNAAYQVAQQHFQRFLLQAQQAPTSRA